MTTERSESGISTEHEITEPVGLCATSGALNSRAVGWTRVPLHDCTLPGSWGRRKRWDFWCITGPGVAMNITYADVDYLGLADVWFRDFGSGEEVSKSAGRPLARGLSLPDRVGGGPIRFDGSGLSLSIDEVDGGTHIRAAFESFEADVLVQRPQAHESLGVVIPWSSRRFQYTNKDVARPAEGIVRWRDATHLLSPDGSAWGCLDFGRGKWPYRTKWNWGAGAGIVQTAGGPVSVGVQLGGKWTDGTGMTENALCVGGRLSKISEELAWGYDTNDWLRSWTIRTPTTSRVDLTFTPLHDKRSRLQLGVASSSVDQCFGTYSGTIVPDDGRTLALNDVFGWAEEATWRW